MNNIENLYTVIKNFLPYAGNYLKGSPIESYLPQLQGMIDMIESFGGIQTVSHLFSELSQAKNATAPTHTISSFSNNSTTNQQVAIQKKSNDLKSIDSYNRI